MDNKLDFTVSTDVIAETMEAVNNLKPLYSQVITDIKKASEELIDTSNWKGKARDEFKDTYRIIEHYLEDDEDKISSISDILKGFKEIYDAVDGDAVPQLGVLQHLIRLKMDLSRLAAHANPPHGSHFFYDSGEHIISPSTSYSSKISF